MGSTYTSVGRHERTLTPEEVNAAESTSNAFDFFKKAAAQKHETEAKAAAWQQTKAARQASAPVATSVPNTVPKTLPGLTYWPRSTNLFSTLPV